MNSFPKVLHVDNSFPTASFFRGVETEPPEAVEAIAMDTRGPHIDAR